MWSTRKLVAAVASSAYPLIFTLIVLLAASKGLVSGGRLRYSLIPIDATLFAIPFGFALLMGSGLTILTICKCSLQFWVAIVSANAALHGAMFLSPLGGIILSGGLAPAIFGLIGRVFLGIRITKAGYARLVLVGMILQYLRWYVARGFIPHEIFGIIIASAWYLPVGLSLVFEAYLGSVAFAQKPLALQAEQINFPRLPLKFGLAVAFVPPLVGLVVLTVIGMVNYDGYCYGFTDGKSPCSMLDSVFNGIVFMLLFFSIPCAGWVGLVLMATRFRAKIRS